MSLLNRYGEMPLPEEKTQIRLVENPVEVAKAAYEIWLPLAKKAGFRIETCAGGIRYDTNIADALLDEAQRCLAPHSSLILAAPVQLERIVNNISPEDDYSGIFVSALANTADGIQSVFKHKILGYRLQHGKFLVVEKGSEVVDLGRRAEGIIFNFMVSKEGVTEFASEASGVQINAGRAMRMSKKARGGVHANFGYIFDFADRASGGLQVEFGDYYGFLPSSVTLGMHANGGVQGRVVIIHELNYAEAFLETGPNLAHVGNIAERKVVLATSGPDDKPVISPQLSNDKALELLQLFKLLRRMLTNSDHPSKDGVKHAYDVPVFEKKILEIGNKIAEITK